MENIIRRAIAPNVHRCAFTGYRPAKMPFGYDELDPRCIDFKNQYYSHTSPRVKQSLHDEISIVQEGSFVETGGNPALKVVGQIQTIVGSQRVVVELNRDRAINSDEIKKLYNSRNVEQSDGVCETSMASNSITGFRMWPIRLCASHSANSPQKNDH